MSNISTQVFNFHTWILSCDSNCPAFFDFFLPFSIWWPSLHWQIFIFVPVCIDFPSNSKGMLGDAVFHYTICDYVQTYWFFMINWMMFLWKISMFWIHVFNWKTWWVLFWYFLSQMSLVRFFKVGTSPSKKKIIYLLQWKPFKMMKRAFYVILKAPFVLKIFNFLSRCFGHAEKMAWSKR